jgi:hypothetical protein
LRKFVGDDRRNLDILGRTGGELLFDGFAGAAGLADFRVHSALDFGRCRVHAGGELDRRVPGDLAFVLLNLESLPDGALLDALVRRRMGAEGAEQPVIARRGQLDLRGQRTAGRLRE